MSVTPEQVIRVHAYAVLNAFGAGLRIDLDEPPPAGDCPLLFSEDVSPAHRTALLRVWALAADPTLPARALTATGKAECLRQLDECLRVLTQD